jgi:hypothetical protein
MNKLTRLILVHLSTGIVIVGSLAADADKKHITIYGNIFIVLLLQL